MSPERFVIPTSAKEVLALADLKKISLKDLPPSDREQTGIVAVPYELDPGTPLHPVIRQPSLELIPDFAATNISPDMTYPKTPSETM